MFKGIFLVFLFLITAFATYEVAKADPVTRHIYANWCPGYGFRLVSEGPCPEEGVAVSATWIDPTTRKDGTGLSGGEIDHYKIYWRLPGQPFAGSIEVSTKPAIIAIPDTGHELVMTTVDSEGIESAFSQAWSF